MRFLSKAHSEHDQWAGSDKSQTKNTHKSGFASISYSAMQHVALALLYCPAFSVINK
jgi:hypothetical protein